VVTEDGAFTAPGHRLVLAAGSSVLRTSMSSRWSASSAEAAATAQVTLPAAASADEATLLLNWLYTGALSLPRAFVTTAARLLQVAHELQIAPLVSVCEARLAKAAADEENAPSLEGLLDLAESLELDKLGAEVSRAILSGSDDELQQRVLAAWSNSNDEKWKEIRDGTRRTW